MCIQRKEKEQEFCPGSDSPEVRKDAAEPQEGESSGEEMSLPEKEILCQLLPESEALPYPLLPLAMSRGPATREYSLPEEKREEIFRSLYPFTPSLSLEDQVFDLHQGETFYVREYRVIREHNRNMLVSPFYPQTGGTVLDWLPNRNASVHVLTLHQPAAHS